MRTKRSFDGSSLAFPPEQRLSARQIASFFSRIAESREKSKQGKSRGKRSNDEEKEEDEETDELEYFEDAGFRTDFDIVFDAIYDTVKKEIDS